MSWPVIRPTYAEIHLDSVIANSRLLASRASSPLLAVVKADAYGHGACAVARALQRAETVVGFAVSLVEEGIELRQAGIQLPILVMGPSLMDAHETIVEQELTPLISDERHLKPLARVAEASGTVLDVHLKFDTGMSRLGLSWERASEMLAAVARFSSLRLTGVASHLACADIDDPENAESMTMQQLARFDKLRASCRAGAREPLLFHVANSAGILRFPRSRADLARPGLALYGNGGTGSDGLRQGMSLRSAITQLREVSTGDSVSYGARWTATRPSRLAIVPVGYADGLPRNLSGKGSALVAGERWPIVGTVSMDMIVVDVTDLPSPQLGQEVVVLGRQGDAEIRAAEIAEHCDISEYEVSCGVSRRVPRKYGGLDV